MVVHGKSKIAKFKTARMKHGARKAGKSRNVAAGSWVHLSFAQAVASFVPTLSPIPSPPCIRLAGWKHSWAARGLEKYALGNPFG